MKKILGVSLVALMAVSTARADIASTAYVTGITGSISNLNTAADNLVAAINAIDVTAGGVSGKQDALIGTAPVGDADSVDANKIVIVGDDGKFDVSDYTVGAAAAKAIAASIADNEAGLTTGDQVYDYVADQFSAKTNASTGTLVTHTANTSIGSATQPVYIQASGVPATVSVDSTATEDSSNLITSGAVYDAIDALGGAASLGVAASIADNETGLTTGDQVYDYVADQFSAKTNASTGTLVTHTANTSIGSATQPVYIQASGVPATVSVDSTATEDSSNLITSGAVYTGLAGKQDTIAAGTYVSTVSTDNNGGNVVTAVSGNSNGTVSVTTGNALMATDATGSDGTYVLTKKVDGTTGAITYKWETITRVQP